MEDLSASPPQPAPLAFRALLKTPLSVMGLVSLAIFAVILVFRVVMDVTGMGGDPGPYGGLVTYIILPSICGASVAFAAGGMLLARWKYIRTGRRIEPLSWRQSWKTLALVACVTAAWLGLSLFGTYKAYQYSDSNAFCGLVCHQVMEPEYTAYSESVHARVRCAECHIGSGADWFVKAKLSGMRQLWVMARGTYHTPVETPVRNLRPAQETCEECHWPGRFSGSVERVVTHYAPDDVNTPTRFRLLVRVGGGRTGSNQPPGVHWHVSHDMKVEYLPVDEKRQDIPYVRVTYADGRREEFATAPFDRSRVDESRLRTMDCLDCHNRPSHVFRSPNRALDDAMDKGLISPALPWIKKAALEALEKTYRTKDEAMAGIDAAIDAYAAKRTLDAGQQKQLAAARAEIKHVYRVNFFPEHGVDYRGFIENTGHFEYKGCERCHDGRHKTPDGAKTVATKCDNCHQLIGQATGVKEVAEMKYGLVPFEHPEDPVAPGKTCSSCHALNHGGKESEKDGGKKKE
jgi:hypothetical protein